ncbi:MAG: prepilin-type N-terminal cleavage/methylation domain-containing protein [Dechloromonas sp.]|nr:prepilin-type N-terminal cleavage/methylation domain-containing protein [Dechloromonas sp.]
MKQQHGFTLIEIAIVLVVIGLLLGGVLKGQALVTQGKIRAVAQELESVAASLLNYQSRYQALPGDDNRAAGRWSAVNGNLDGNLSGNFNSLTDTDESRLLWSHVRHAGFIGGDTASLVQPANAAGGIIGVEMDAGVSGSGSTSSIDLPGLVVCASNLPAKIAEAIDQQSDDGLPGKGSIHGFKQSSSLTLGASSPTDSASASAYVDEANNLYTVCRKV